MRWKRVFLATSTTTNLFSLASIGLLLSSSLTPLAAIAAPEFYSKPSFDETNCEEILPCHVCSNEEKVQVRECATSGKIQTLNCPLDTVESNGTLPFLCENIEMYLAWMLWLIEPNSCRPNDLISIHQLPTRTTNIPDEMNTVTRYVTCNRTQDDEQSRFVHFQLFCLIMGTISYVWVRRYRVIYASLFEQRKLSLFPRRGGGDVESSSATNGGGGVLSVIEMATREEISPLSNVNLEVVWIINHGADANINCELVAVGVGAIVKTQTPFWMFH